MRGEIGSFSFDVAKRILSKLAEGDVNRTNLATHTGLNYRTLVRYLNMLNSVGWTVVSNDGRVVITPLGRETGKKLVQLHLDDPEVHGMEHPQIRELAEKQRHMAVPLMTGRSSESGSLAAAGNGLVQRRTDRTGSQTQVEVEMEVEANKQAQTRTKNVLIVDDEPDIALTYDMFLRSVGRYNVRVFTEPSSALKDFISKIHYYDLVILDIRMPDINGLQMYQSMTAINPRCKFLFVTSLDAVDELVSILPEIDTREIIRKPIGKHNFIHVVDRLLLHN